MTFRPRRTGARRWAAALSAGLLLSLSAACTGSDAVLLTNSLLAGSAAANPPVMRAIDGIPGWKRTGPPQRFDKEGLYGHIDGGAEIVLQYGFRELSVFAFRPSEAQGQAIKEVGVEIYRMKSAEAAFGLYSTKLEGQETAWSGIKTDHWVSQGQANLVKGEYLVNILAPECTDREIGEFAAALERKVPGRGAKRPPGMACLPAQGMVPGSGRYIRGPLAARNESPLLEAPFWEFEPRPGSDERAGPTEAFSAKYGAAPAVSKLVVVKFKEEPSPAALAANVLAVFKEYLEDVRFEGGLVEGRNAAGRWFLFQAKGAAAALVLGDPDREVSLARTGSALSRASR